MYFGEGYLLVACNRTEQNRTEQNSWLGLTASLLAGTVFGFPQKRPGPGQPAQNRTLTVPCFERYIPITGWRAIPVFVCSRHHAYREPPLSVRKWILKDYISVLHFEKLMINSRSNLELKSSYFKFNSLLS